MKKCGVCLKEFIPERFHPFQKFCSAKCGKNASYRRLKGLCVENKKYTCIVCEKNFIQRKANHTKYCSQSCKKLGVFRRYNGLEIKGPKKHIKGSGYITVQGYKILSRKHPNSSKRGQILEHILIMSEHLGRPLRKDESVHHKNGIRHDNRLENLELWSKATHGNHQRWGQRLGEKLKYFIDFIESYGCKVEKNEFVAQMMTGLLGGQAQGQ